MANEITYTGHGDLFIAATLNRALHETIVDRADLRRMVQYRGSVNGTGSLASKLSTVAFDDAMAAANADETTAPGYTDIGTGAITITVARQVLARVLTDPYQVAAGGKVGIQTFANDMARAAVLRFTDMICALFTGLTTNVGTSGAAMTVDDAYDAIYALIKARAPGPYYGVLAPIQLTHFMDSLRGEGGAVQYVAETAQFLGLVNETGSQGYGYHGRWNGVDWLSADSVNTSGADKVGAVFGWGAFVYQDGVPAEVTRYAAPGSFQSVIPDGGSVFVEFERLARAGHTEIVGNYYVGVAEQEDARGVKITTSAT